MIKSIGPASSKVMIILDYPSLPEVEIGIASHGYVRKDLENWLKQAGTVKIDECYVTCFVKDPIKTPNTVQRKNWAKYLDDNNLDIKKYQELIVYEINMVRPNVIILVGEAAVQGITGETSIMKYRGTIMDAHYEIQKRLDNPKVKLFPIYHPREIYKDYKVFHYTLADVKKAIGYKNDPTPYKSNINTWVCRSPDAALNYFKRVKDAPYIALDIETYYNYITAIGFSADGIEGMSIPMTDRSMDNFTIASLYDAIYRFINSGIPFFGHNFIYDCWHLHRTGFLDWERFKFHACTLNLGKLIYPELPASLAFYNSLYTLMPYFKDEGKEWDPTKTKKDQLYHYNAKDNICDFQVYEGMIKDAKDFGVLDFHNQHSVPLFHFYRRIDEIGIRIDEDKRTKLINKYTECLEIHTAALQTHLGFDFNPLSPKQAQWMIYDVFGLPEKYKKSPSGGKVLRTDAAAINWFILNLDLEPLVIDLLCDLEAVKHYSKLLSYLDCIVHKDGRLRSHYKPFGTESGRSSTNYSQDVFFYLEGTNVKRRNMGLPLQTIPKHGFELPNGFKDGKDLREIFVPSSGHCFFEFDQSQAEARIVAVLAKDYELLERFDNSDVHIWTASFVLEKNIEDITPEERQTEGKRTRHAGHYGMGANKLAEIAKLPLHRAKIALENFHKHSPNIRGVFHKDINDFVGRNAYLSTSFGRSRQFFGRLSDAETLRQAYSYIPQSLVPDNQRRGMLEVEEKMGDKIRWVGEFHDGGLGETKTEYVERVRDVSIKAMDYPIMFDRGSIIRDVELKIPIEFLAGETDANWTELEEIK